MKNLNLFNTLKIKQFENKLVQKPFNYFKLFKNGEAFYELTNNSFECAEDLFFTVNNFSTKIRLSDAKKIFKFINS